MAQHSSTRLVFLDNLRTLLAVLVVAHHAGQPYGPTGGSWPISHGEHAPILGAFFHTNASFFMGLFFLVSGYFMPASFERKGSGGFLRDRWWRLGLPLALFVFVLFPLGSYAVEGSGAGLLAYWGRRLFVQHNIEFGHLWFVSHLLVYGLIYALWRRLRGPVFAAEEKPFPGTAMILGYVVILAFISAVVRHWFPIDRWVFIGVPSELAHLPQYLSLFLIGIMAHRYRWLERIPDSQGTRWLVVGMVAVVFRYACTIFGWRFCWRPLQFVGINWTDLFWNLWEAFLCVGLCIGLIWLFRRAMNHQKTFARFLSNNSYGVYLVHLHNLVGIQMLLSRTHLGPLTLTAISTVGTVLISYFTCWWLRKIPGVSRVI